MFSGHGQLRRCSWFYCIQGQASKIWFWMGCWSSSFQWFSTYTILLYSCLSFPYPTCRGSHGSDVRSSVAAAFRAHKQSAVWKIYKHRTMTRTQDARLQHLIYTNLHPIRARKPQKKNRPVRLTRWDWNVKCRETQVRCKQIFNLRFLKVVCQQWQGIQKALPSARGKVRSSKKKQVLWWESQFKDPTCSHLWFEEVYLKASRATGVAPSGCKGLMGFLGHGTCRCAQCLKGYHR